MLAQVEILKRTQQYVSGKKTEGDSIMFDHVQLIDKVIELIGQGKFVTRIVMGRDEYAEFHLCEHNVARGLGGEFVGGIRVEMGQNDGWIFWHEPATADRNQLDMRSVYEALANVAEYIDNENEESRRP